MQQRVRDASLGKKVKWAVPSLALPRPPSVKGDLTAADFANIATLEYPRYDLREDEDYYPDDAPYYTKAQRYHIPTLDEDEYPSYIHRPHYTKYPESRYPHPKNPEYKFQLVSRPRPTRPAPYLESASFEAQNLPTSQSQAQDLLSSLQLSNSKLQKKLSVLETSLGSLEAKIELLLQSNFHPPLQYLRTGSDSTLVDETNSTCVDSDDIFDIISIYEDISNPEKTTSTTSCNQRAVYPQQSQCEWCNWRQIPCEAERQPDGSLQCVACFWYGTDCDLPKNECKLEAPVPQHSAPLTRENLDSMDMSYQAMVSRPRTENTSMSGMLDTSSRGLSADARKTPILRFSYTETMATADANICIPNQQQPDILSLDANNTKTESNSAENYNQQIVDNLVEEEEGSREDEGTAEAMDSFYLFLLILTLTDDSIWETLPPTTDDHYGDAVTNALFHDVSKSTTPTYNQDVTLRRSSLISEDSQSETSETSERKLITSRTPTKRFAHINGLCLAPDPESCSLGMGTVSNTCAPGREICDTAEEPNGEESTTKDRTNSRCLNASQGNKGSRIPKRSRTDRDNSGDGDESDRGSPKKRITEAIRKIEKKLACPFAKAYPHEYPQCQLRFRKNLSGVKEHLKRSHFGGTLPPEVLKARTWNEVFVYCNNSWKSDIPSQYLDISIPMQWVQECRDQQIEMDPLATTDEGLQSGIYVRLNQADANRNFPRPILPRLSQTSHDGTMSSSRSSDIAISYIQDSLCPTTPASSVDSVSFKTPPFDQQVIRTIDDDQPRGIIDLFATDKLNTPTPEPQSQLSINFDDFSDYIHSNHDFDLIQSFGSTITLDPEISVLPEDLCLGYGLDQQRNEKYILPIIEDIASESSVSNGEAMSTSDKTPPPPTPGESSGASAIQSPDLIPTPHKKYTLRVRRQEKHTDHRTVKNRGPQKFQFDSMEEFRDRFETWMIQTFSDPLFDWREWEFEDPKGSDRISDLDALADELEWIWDAYRTEGAAFFLVRKLAKGIT
ncbi:hypothetical protein TWF694_007820 [Orbilia ellipsospora]|uniref:C2H2-type domain-containing protein n=1 Tax=Orbilia ellipsospora TaxID=2528407 RepID=A0AAV9XIY8_9PEZI